MNIREIMQHTILSLFSNREWAIIIWGIIALVVMLFSKNLRRVLLNIVKCFFDPKLFRIFAIGYIYLSCIIFIIYRINLWNISLLKDTLIYIFITSTQMVFKGFDENRQCSILSSSLENIKATAVIAFYINIITFNFWIEFIGLPVVCFLVLVQAFAAKSSKNEEKRVGICLQYILTMIFISISIFALFELIKSYNIIFQRNTVLSLVLPIILTFSFSSYIFALSVYSAYEEWFIRIKSSTYNNSGDYKFRRNKVLKTCLFDLNKIRYISKNFHIFMMQSDEEYITKLNEIEQRYKQR